jgi:outer membrane protein assembly complex protein YaeT
VDTTDRLIFGEYDVTRKFTTRVTMQPDNSYRFDVNHDFEFGGESTKDLRFQKPDDRRVGTVQYTGIKYFSEPRLVDKFKVKPGDKYDYFKVRRGLDRLQSFYADQQLLEANVKLHRTEHNKVVDLQLQMNPGRKVNFIYEGYTPTGGLRDRVRRIWVEGVFDLQRAQDAIAEIRNELLKRNYIDSKVSYDIKEIGDDRKRVLFQIDLGTRYREVRVSFDGAHGISAKELTKALDKNDLNQTVITDFGKVKSFLEGYYRDQGFLTANVQESHLVSDQPTKVVRIVVPVEEGPQYTIGTVSFRGNSVMPEEKLRRALPELRPGTPYVPTKRDPAILAVQTQYWNAGYNNADIRYSVTPHPENAKVDVVFNINPGREAVVKGINVTGTDQTTAGMIKSQIELKPGEPLNYDKLSKSRTNLYETSAFQLVEVQPRGAGPVAADGTRPVTLNVNVHEVQPFQWRYGFYFDTDRGPGVSSDFSNHNTLGNARVLGLYTRYDRDLQEARLYMTQPFVKRLPLKINFAGYFNRFTHYAPGTSSKTYIDDHFGFTIDNETRFRKDYVLTYGYQLERARVIDMTEAIPPSDSVQLLAPLTFGLTRDRRDDPLNASRGDFMSQGFLAGFSALGSSQPFLKYTGQYNQYLPLGKRTQIPFSKAYKSRLVYAGSLRLGLAKGLGESNQQITAFTGQSTLIATERFFAGGGTTIRGFKQDEVGPKNSVGNPLGGNAMLIFNNELRFPLWKMFDGVGFIDAGNVWPTIGNIDIADIRKTAGVGLRVYTPFVLLRADYGVKLDRRTGESFGQFFFSIGQAF